MDIYADLLCFVVLVFGTSVGVMSTLLEKRTFLFHSKPLNWTEASNLCINSGGMLAKISDISTLLDVQEDINTLKSTPSFWIGLGFNNGLWQWQDNSEVEWSSWTPGNHSDAKCVSASWNSTYTWNRTKCSKPLPFLCEFPAGSCYFRRYNHSSIVGHNIFSKTSTSLEECHEICVQSIEVPCMSFEYNAFGHFCQLSNTNRWINPKEFVHYDAYWDYFHRTCITARLWSDDDQVFGNVVETSTVHLPMTTDLTSVITIEPRRYVLYNDTVTWDEAKDICNNKGGILATIHDKSTLPETGHINNKQVWIGLSRKQNIWYWINDTIPVTWSNWRYTPSAFDLNKCASVLLDSNFWWYPTICSRKQQFICQFPSASCQYVVVRNASMLANNNLVLTNISLEDCMEACNSSTDFTCRSFEYNHIRKQCHISKGNRWMFPDFYREDVINWEYHHRKCNFGVKEGTPEEITTHPATDYTTTYIYTSEQTDGVDFVSDGVVFMIATPNIMDIIFIVLISLEFGGNLFFYANMNLRQLVFIQNSREEMTTMQRLTTTVEHIKTFEEIIEQLVSFGENIKRKRSMEAKTSVFDSRPSATSVGVIAIVILSCIFGGVILLDLGTIGAHCKNMKHPNKRKRKIKKVQKCPKEDFTDLIEVCKSADDTNIEESVENEQEIKGTNNNDINDFKAEMSKETLDDKDLNEKEETKVEVEIDNHYVSIIDIRMDPNIKENDLVTYM